MEKIYCKNCKIKFIKSNSCPICNRVQERLLIKFDAFDPEIKDEEKEF